MKNICPVCGYDNLRRPPSDYLICPCCRTEFGVSDYSWSHGELRQMWISQGAKWFSNRTIAPNGWSPIAQLRNIGYICNKDDIKSITQARIEIQSTQVSTNAPNDEKIPYRACLPAHGEV